jgi:hypothetical protein
MGLIHHLGTLGGARTLPPDNPHEFVDTYSLEPVNSDFMHPPPFDACGDAAAFEGDREPEGVPGWLAVVLVMLSFTIGAAVMQWIGGRS